MSVFDKAEVIRGLLDEGHTVLVLVRKHTQVQVPDHAFVDDKVCLGLSYHFPVPMVGFELDDLGFRVELSFNRTPQLCVVPWAYVVSVAAHLSDAAVVVNWDDPNESAPDPKPQLKLVS